MIGWQALAAHIATHPVTGDVAAMRAAFGRLAPQGPTGQWIDLAGVPCLRVGLWTGRPLIWLHGGGLVFGSPESHAAMGASLATLLQRPVILPRYRLAPEHVWPAPLHDVLAVLDAQDGPVDLGGDSAGGYLALTGAMLRKGAVRRLALISPNTDRTGQSTTRQRNSPQDIMNDDAMDTRLAALSFGDGLAGHPDASPLSCDLAGLPPIWIAAATQEVLLDDTLLLVRALGRAGVPTTAQVFQGLCHMWTLWPDALPEAQQALGSLAGFLAG